MDLQDLRERVNTNLDTFDADHLWAAWLVLTDKVRAGKYPEAIFMLDVDPDDEDLVHGALLVCPRPGCNSVNDAAEVDAGYRNNQLDEYIPCHHDGTVTLQVISGEREFHTVAYQCNGCGMPFDLPEFADTSWG